MIRVNLLNDISVAGNSGAAISPVPEAEGFQETALQGGGVGSGLGFAESSQFDVAIKIFFLIVPLLLTFCYRQFLVNRAESRNASLVKQKTAGDTKLRSFDASLRDIEKFEEEKRKLNAQLGVIKTLSKERLKSVKGLDALQGLIPSSAWLNSLKFSGDKVDLEGYAVNDVVVSEFMQLLTSSIYFSHVILADSTEATTPEGSVKRFHIKCNLESI